MRLIASFQSLMKNNITCLDFLVCIPFYSSPKSFVKIISFFLIPSFLLRPFGNHCALEWILAQYKEKKPKDPTIAEKFKTYHFAYYKEQVIDLLQRVCTVSVETIQIIQQIEL
jgi:hypothetical protein